MDLPRAAFFKPPLSATLWRLAGHALWFGFVFGCGFVLGRLT